MPISRILFCRRLLSCEKCRLFSRFSSQYGFNTSDTAVQVFLNNLMTEYEHLNSKIRRTPEESKRLFEINPIVNVLKQRNNLHDNIELLTKRQSDEHPDFVKKETELYIKRMTDVDRELQSILLEPSLTEGSVLIEVAAGSGGHDASLFARDLFEMYELYATYKDWEVSIVTLEKSDIGGFRKASMVVEGVGVPELMKIEAGIHRVQRIPVTEKDGGIHTSTASVTVVRKPTDNEANIPDQDLIVENKRANNADCQDMNTANNAVRIIHTPTATVVECQEGISQSENKEIAIDKLKTQREKQQQQEQKSKINSKMETQSSSSDENQFIRTYNYLEEIVAEHREGGGIMRNLHTFMEGSYLLEQMQNNVLRVHRRREFFEEISQLAKKANVKLAETN